MSEIEHPTNSADLLLIDCHSDMMVDVRRRRAVGETAVLLRRHVPRLVQGGVRGAVCVVGGDVPILSAAGDTPYKSALALLQMLKEEALESDEQVVLGDSPAAIRSQAKAHKFVAIPSFEGAGPLARDLNRVEVFYSAGVRAIGLTWNQQNSLAAGVGVTPDSGLTALGKRAVVEMNRVGMVIDVAHLSTSGFWDVIEATKAPIIASHANGRGKWNNPRNLSDDQLAAIRDVDGMVGVVLYPLFLGPQPLGIDDVVAHVLFLADHLGIERVGIGADFIDYAPEEILKDNPASPRDPRENAYPSGLEDCRSLSSLLGALLQRGLSKDEVAGIAGENFLRVMEHVQQAREQ